MSQENHGRLAIMSFNGACDLGQLSLSVSPCCLFVRRQCCRKLEAAKSNNFFKLSHATLIQYFIGRSSGLSNGANKITVCTKRRFVYTVVLYFLSLSLAIVASWSTPKGAATFMHRFTQCLVGFLVSHYFIFKTIRTQFINN
jgi:hypothetical protein